MSLTFIVDLVQQGISEKVALTVVFLSSFVTGYVLGYIRSWRLALAQSSVLPCIVIAARLMNRFGAIYMQCVPHVVHLVAILLMVAPF